MKQFTILALAALLCSLPAQVAEAAAYGSTIFSITNARLQKETSPGVWVDATSAQVSILPTSVITSETLVDFNGNFAGSGVTPGFDALQSFVADPSFAAPLENTFSALGIVANGYSRADTTGSGVDLVSVGGVNTKTLAELSSVNSYVGNSFSNVGGNSQFKVKVNQTGNYRLAYTASLNMVASLNGFAENEFRVQVNGGSVFVNYAESVLNYSRDNLLLNGGNDRVTAGSHTVAATNFFSPSVNFNSTSTTYQFNINQNAVVGVVPEPASICVFGLVGLALVAAKRRRA